MDRNYGGVIWTNHALQRLEQRDIKQSDAWSAWRRPDTSKFDSKRGAWVYRRVYGSEEIEIAAKKNEKGEWLILSVWANKISRDHKKVEKKSLFTKLLSIFRN